MNLADTKAQVVQQSDRIGNRPSIIPERRDTRAPALQGSASLASARRGNGGAQELMRTLGLVGRAASDFQEYAQSAHAERERDNIAQGAADQQMGAVDPEMVEKSEGYRNAVTKGRTVTFFNDAVREFQPDLIGLIEHQDDPDLAVRQAQVKTRLEEFYHGFALDPETGKPKDFMQSPGAMRYLAEAIGKTRGQFEAAAMERIEARFNEESRGNAGRYAVDAMRNGNLDLAFYRSLLPKTVTDEQARETLLHAIPEGAAKLWEEQNSVDGLRVYDAFLGKPKAPQPAVPTVPQGVSTAAHPTPSAALGLPVAGGHITSRFGEHRESRRHNGVDIAVPVGTPVRVPMGGEIVRVWEDAAGGLSMRVRHDDGSVSGFAHLSAADLPAGSRVQAGDVVAKSGNSGRSTGPHLHWTMTRDGRRVNPLGSGGQSSGGASTPDDPVVATPGFRLAHPAPDPVTAYEQSDEVPALLGADKLGLSAEDLGRLREQRDQLANRMRVEYTRKVSEEQEFNATSMALGLFGQGAPVTSVDIMQAVQSQAVSPQQAMQLHGILRQNANAAQSYTDRQEARADRAEAKTRRDQAEAISGRYIANILSGRMSGSEARSAVLRELPHIGDPAVQASVANTVLGTANDIENLNLNSKPVREAVRRVSDSRDHWLQQAGPKAPKLASQIDNLLDQAQAEIAMRVRDGEEAATAEKTVLARYKPKLEALTASRKAPTK